MANQSLMCVFCKRYLFDRPRQAPCGDRLCGECYDEYSNEKQVTCPTCQQPIELEHCFRDKAVEYELLNTTLKCTNAGCPWEGESKHFREHLQMCKYAVVLCPNSKYGCQEKLQKTEVSKHMSQCGYAPVVCQWCSKALPSTDMQKHIDLECQEVTLYCSNGCGTQLSKKELSNHLKTDCNLQLRDCEYKDQGCQFKGNIKELTKHDREQMSYHIQLFKQANKKMEKSYTARLQKMDQTLTAVKNQLADIHGEVSAKIQPVIDAVIKLEPTIQQMQEGFNEMALMVQTLQATSYNGTFIWKVPEVQRRRHEALIGKTISLYSAPFYTSRHGYKLCLRLYMDGDGSGKGTHLSFFLTIMKGEFDALLQWPFKQTVTLTLLDQDKQKNIIQSFHPEPTSSSFQRPQNEMNVASGCPLFAPLSVLNSSSYVKQDTMFLKCEIDCNGLTVP